MGEEIEGAVDRKRKALDKQKAVTAGLRDQIEQLTESLTASVAEEQLLAVKLAECEADKVSGVSFAWIQKTAFDEK